MKIIITALITLFLSHNLAAAERYQEQKVLYHVNYHEQSRIDETLVNVANHIEALGEDRV